MNYNSIKKIGRIALISSILYFSNGKQLIAPKSESMEIEAGKAITKDTRKVIVIDPGHGMSNRDKDLMDWGKDYENYKEAEIALEKAKNIKNMLNPNKYNVILTREDNITPCPIESRPEIANEKKADLFLSIHLNDFENWKSISGSEVYWRYKKDKELAKLAAKNLEEITSIPHRHVSWGEYLVLKGVNCPAAIIEIGYLLNEHDREEILKKTDVEKAIVKTIEEHLK